MWSQFDAAVRPAIRLAGNSQPALSLATNYFRLWRYKRLCMNNTVLHIHNYHHALNTE